MGCGTVKKIAAAACAASRASLVFANVVQNVPPARAECSACPCRMFRLPVQYAHLLLLVLAHAPCTCDMPRFCAERHWTPMTELAASSLLLLHGKCTSQPKNKVLMLEIGYGIGFQLSFAPPQKFFERPQQVQQTEAESKPHGLWHSPTSRAQQL
jgi:hypothetical protein